MKSDFFAKLKKRKLSLTVAVLILAAGGYFGYAKFSASDETVRYVVAQVQKGALIVSVSGSGQVSVSNQVEIKPKTSGEVIYVGVKKGQEAAAGTLIAQLDVREAQKAVRDAAANLESAGLSLEKLKKPADALSVLQAENALAQAKESKQKAEADLEKARDDGFNVVANVFLDLPAIMTSLNGTLFGSDFGPSQWNIDYYVNTVKTYDDKVIQYKNAAYEDYQTARTAYDKNFEDYKTATRNSDSAVLESLLNKTYDTSKSIAEALKSANNLIQFYKDKLTERGLKPDAKADAALANLNVYIGKVNSHLLSILSIKNTIQNDRDAIAGAERSIAEKTESIAKLKAGADALDIQSAELTIKQRENSLLDAKEKLADYFIRVPFDGVIAQLNVKKGDSVSSASALATLITKQKIAEISLNEVDAAKVKVGQKATLAFDAVPDITITGQVAEVETMGTVSQGVVTYTIKIIFDTQDDRVKTAMSVSAAIVIEAKIGALLVPNSAVKIQGETNYVEVAEGDEQSAALAANSGGAILLNAPRRRTIEIGAANDEFTEVLSGLNEGEAVIVRTVQPNSAQSAQSQQNSALRIPGLNTGSGSGVRGGMTR